LQRPNAAANRDMQSYLDSLDEELSDQPGFKKPPTKIVRKCRTTSQTGAISAGRQ